MPFVSGRGNCMAEWIEIELAYAEPGRQFLLALRVPEGSSVRQAVLECSLQEQLAGLDLANMPLGIFGKVVAQPERQQLQAGDRIEIYRPLLADPKEVRKRRAERARQLSAG